MKSQKWDLVLFDTIGTTVKESAVGKSTIIESFRQAFAMNGVQAADEVINRQRGKGKKEAIRNILDAYDLPTGKLDKIYEDFIARLNASLSYFSEMEGASEVFRILKEKETKVGLGSGLPLGFMKKLLSHLGWQEKIFDYINSSEELGKGRPDSVMIADAMSRLKIHDKKKVLKIGDTVVDIQEGKNAGVVTAGVLTGTQTSQALQEYQPDYLFSDITELLKVMQTSEN